jgi:hypothetical protein
MCCYHGEKGSKSNRDTEVQRTTPSVIAFKMEIVGLPANVRGTVNLPMHMRLKVIGKAFQ